MQIVFFRQHFGELAIGMSNADQIQRLHREKVAAKAKKNVCENFFTVKKSISHPWRKSEEVQVAIYGTGLKLAENSQIYNARPKIYARVEVPLQTTRTFLYFVCSMPVFVRGLPDPCEIAEELLGKSWAYLRGLGTTEEFPVWHMVNPGYTRGQIPHEAAVMLRRITNQIDDAFRQGAKFFTSK